MMNLRETCERLRKERNTLRSRVEELEAVVDLVRMFSQAFTPDGKGIGNDMKRAVIALDTTKEPTP